MLDEAFLAEQLESEIGLVTPGTRQVDCTWGYQVPDGPGTTLQVQVMTMEQTGDRIGTDALEWGLSRAPAGRDISENPSIDAPNGSYVLAPSEIVFVVDSVGRLVTITAHTDTPEANRLAIIDAVLSGLAADHS